MDAHGMASRRHRGARKLTAASRRGQLAAVIGEAAILRRESTDPKN